MPQILVLHILLILIRSCFVFNKRREKLMKNGEGED